MNKNWSLLHLFMLLASFFPEKSFSMDELRCYCNTVNCIRNNYTCRSTGPDAACYTELGSSNRTVMGHTYKHGCVESLHDAVRATCIAQVNRTRRIIAMFKQLKSKNVNYHPHQLTASSSSSSFDHPHSGNLFPSSVDLHTPALSLASHHLHHHRHRSKSSRLEHKRQRMNDHRDKHRPRTRPRRVAEESRKSSEDEGRKEGEVEMKIVCCINDMCNYDSGRRVENFGQTQKDTTRTKANHNSPLNSGDESLRVTQAGYGDQILPDDGDEHNANDNGADDSDYLWWFNFAIIFVPIAGGFILTALVLFAAHVIRQDRRRQKYLSQLYRNNNCLIQTEFIFYNNTSNTRNSEDDQTAADVRKCNHPCLPHFRSSPPPSKTSHCKYSIVNPAGENIGNSV